LARFSTNTIDEMTMVDANRIPLNERDWTEMDVIANALHTGNGLVASILLEDALRRAARRFV
jgi:hypothetical protein